MNEVTVTLEITRVMSDEQLHQLQKIIRTEDSDFPDFGSSTTDIDKIALNDILDLDASEIIFSKYERETIPRFNSRGGGSPIEVPERHHTIILRSVFRG